QTFVIDELSNWYLRRSRRRFWKNDMSGDKLAAYGTFHAVLEGVARIIAPFVPFLGESLWLRLRPGDGRADGGESVHLERFPEPDDALIDADLERRMAGVLATVALGRAARNKAGIKVRTPLAAMLVHSPKPSDVSWTADALLRHLVLDELNVKSVDVVESTEGIVSVEIKPDFARLGKRFGKRMKAAAAALEALSAADAAAMAASGRIAIEVDGRDESLSLEEVRIGRVTADGYEAEAEGDLTVILDTRLTPELRREGTARDLVNRIQNFRKESGFEVSDRIELSWRAPETIARVIGDFSDHICSETLVETLREGEQDWDSRTSFELDGETVDLWVRKV
ncbi:MAG: DUF5915 domain-containing protein, partial [Candidatus Krumholzibacteria bacterium]|nr:DUF5915 domain-containing protein [Candidatus Krumholzibacteria bacterium]